MQGAPCRPAPCPYLAGARRRCPSPSPTPDVGAFTLQGIGAAAVAGVAVALGGVVAGVGRAIGATTTVPTAPPTLAHRARPPPPVEGRAPTATTVGRRAAPGTRPPPRSPVRPARAIGAAGTVPVGGAASFTDPSTGDPSLVVQPKEGTFAAFDAVCPHEGCIVGYSRAQRASSARATARSSTGAPGPSSTGRRPWPHPHPGRARRPAVCDLTSPGSGRGSASWPVRRGRRRRGGRQLTMVWVSPGTKSGAIMSRKRMTSSQ